MGRLWGGLAEAIEVETQREGQVTQQRNRGRDISEGQGGIRGRDIEGGLGETIEVEIQRKGW